MKSEGFTFYEMKFWSDIFQYMSFKFLKNNSTEKTDVGLHFAQIWAAAPHSKFEEGYLTFNCSHKFIVLIILNVLPEKWASNLV